MMTWTGVVMGFMLSTLAVGFHFRTILTYEKTWCAGGGAVAVNLTKPMTVCYVGGTRPIFFVWSGSGPLARVTTPFV